MNRRPAVHLQLCHILPLCLCLGGAGCTFHYQSKKIQRMLDQHLCQTGYALMVMEREYAIRAEVFRERIQDVVVPDSKRHRRLSKRLDKMSRMLERARKDRKRMLEIDARARSLFADKKKISNRDPEWDTLQKLRDEYEEIGNRLQKAGSSFANALIDFDQKAARVEKAAYCRENLHAPGQKTIPVPQTP
jgi:hypothetical protein